MRLPFLGLDRTAWVSLPVERRPSQQRLASFAASRWRCHCCSPLCTRCLATPVLPFAKSPALWWHAVAFEIGDRASTLAFVYRPLRGRLHCVSSPATGVCAARFLWGMRELVVPGHVSMPWWCCRRNSDGPVRTRQFIALQRAASKAPSAPAWQSNSAATRHTEIFEDQGCRKKPDKKCLGA